MGRGDKKGQRWNVPSLSLNYLLTVIAAAGRIVGIKGIGDVEGSNTDIIFYCGLEAIPVTNMVSIPETDSVAGLIGLAVIVGRRVAAAAISAVTITPVIGGAAATGVVIVIIGRGTAATSAVAARMAGIAGVVAATAVIIASASAAVPIRSTKTVSKAIT